MSTHTKSHPLLQSLPSTFTNSASIYTVKRDVASSPSMKQTNATAKAPKQPRPTKAAQLRLAKSQAKKEWDNKKEGVVKKTSRKATPGGDANLRADTLKERVTKEASEDLQGSVGSVAYPDGHAQHSHNAGNLDQDYSCDPDYPVEIEAYSGEMEDSEGIGGGLRSQSDLGSQDWDGSFEQEQKIAIWPEFGDGSVAFRTGTANKASSRTESRMGSARASAGAPNSSSLYSLPRPYFPARSNPLQSQIQPNTRQQTAPTAEEVLDTVRAARPQFRSLSLGFSHTGASSPCTLPVRYPKHAHNVILQYAFGISPLSSVVIGSNTGPSVKSLYVAPRDGAKSPLSSPLTGSKRLPETAVRSPNFKGGKLDSLPSSNPGLSIPPQAHLIDRAGVSAPNSFAAVPTAGLGLFAGLPPMAALDSQLQSNSATSSGVPIILAGPPPSPGTVPSQLPYQIILQSGPSNTPGQHFPLQIPGFPFSVVPPAEQAQSASGSGAHQASDSEDEEEIVEEKQSKRPTKQELNAEIKLGGLGPDFLSEEYQRKVCFCLCLARDQYLLIYCPPLSFHSFGSRKLSKISPPGSGSGTS